MSIKISGSLPHPLYRGFDKEEHAHLFLERGSFIMRPLGYYREIEDSTRKDKDEGKGRVVGFGPIYISVVSDNHYILCFHGPEVNLEYLACQNRPYVVRLNKPNILARDIASYLERSPELHCDAMLLECIKVVYDKDQTVSELPGLANHELVTMSYGQKDPKFSSDCEYRLVLTLVTADSPPTEIPVELHKRLECAEMVHLQT